MRKVSLKRLIQRSGSLFIGALGLTAFLQLDELDRRISEALKRSSRGHRPTMAEVAPFLGLHNQVYGRYERNETPMQVSRLIHLSEVLDFSPIDLIMAAAPYRLGKTQSEADKRRKLIKVVESLPLDAVESLLVLIEAMAKLPPADEGNASI